MGFLVALSEAYSGRAKNQGLLNGTELPLSGAELPIYFVRYCPYSRIQIGLVFRAVTLFFVRKKKPLSAPAQE